MCQLDNGELDNEMWARLLVWLSTYEREIVMAAIFAIVWAIIWDALKPWSFWGVRKLKNWLSDMSVGRLRKRINKMEHYRNQIASFGSSDKFLYVAILQHVVAMLTMICLGLIVLIFEYAARVGPFAGNIVVAGPKGAFATLSTCIFGIAALFGLNAMRLANLNTPEAVSKKVNELTSEIAGLRLKLDARLQRGEKGLG